MKSKTAIPAVVSLTVPDTLKDLITAMGERLVTWRKSSAASKRDGFTREQEEFLILALEGYRLMAYKLLSGRQKGFSPDGDYAGSPLDESDAASEIAQQCAYKMIRSAAISDNFPFKISKVDELIDFARTSGTKPTGDGSPLNGYIRQMLLFGACRAISQMDKKHKRLTLAKKTLKTRQKNDQSATDYRIINANNNNVTRQVSEIQNFEMLSRIQDHYLENVTYKKKPLISLVGDWRPMDEWTGRCDREHRPKTIHPESLRIHMNNIFFAFSMEKGKTREMKDSL